MGDWYAINEEYGHWLIQSSISQITCERIIPLGKNFDEHYGELQYKKR
jgi:hypothetical protein